MQINTKKERQHIQTSQLLKRVKLSQKENLFTKCPAGQIVKYKLNKKKKNKKKIKRKHLTDLTEEIKWSNWKMVYPAGVSHPHVIQQLYQKNVPNVQLDKL